MKAIIYSEYGSPGVLRPADLPKPQPKGDEILVKVYATGLNAADRMQLSGRPYVVRLFVGGLRKPQNAILGADVAGVVEAVGEQVTRFRPGDAVFGDLAGGGWGGLAEYVCAPERFWAAKPDGAGFEQAAAVPMAAVTALQGLRDKGHIKAGQRVLIHGASGGVGTFAVQIAKAYGAEVTAVCSTRNVDMARSLGADHVIDYTREDFARNGRRYDLILAANGRRTLRDYRRALAPDGICVVAGGAMRQIFQTMILGPVVSAAGGRQMTSLAAQPNSRDLAAVGELWQAGKIRPVIDRCYPLSETAEAFRYLEREHARGKVVISVIGV